MKIFITDFLRFLFWYPLRFSVRFIPRGGYLTLIKQASHIMSRVSGGKKHAMSIVYNKINKESQSNFSAATFRRALATSHVNYAEILYYPHIDEKNIQNIVMIEGRQHLDDALAKKKGVILAFFHFGAQKLIIPAMGHRGYPTNQLAAPPTIWKELEGPNRKSKMYLRSLDLEKECEKNFPVTFHYTGGNIRPLVKCLQNGEVLLYAVDGGYGGKKTISTRLGNLPFDISDTPFRLARITGATILPAFLVRESINRHVLHIHKPLAPVANQKDFSEPAQRLMDMLYQYFIKYPCHYLGQLWLYKKMGRIE